MNKKLMGAINEKVGVNDELIFLGDLVFGRRRTNFIRRQINCRNILFIMGNHDNPFQIRQSFGESNVHRSLTILRGGHQIFLNHSYQEEWPGREDGAWHLYGHHHTNIEDELDQKFPGRKSLDVGVDNAAKILGEYRPFSLEEIERVLS